MIVIQEGHKSDFVCLNLPFLSLKNNRSKKKKKMESVVWGKTMPHNQGHKDEFPGLIESILALTDVLGICIGRNRGSGQDSDIQLRT